MKDKERGIIIVCVGHDAGLLAMNRLNLFAPHPNITIMTPEEAQKYPQSEKTIESLFTKMLIADVQNELKELKQVIQTGNCYTKVKSARNKRREVERELKKKKHLKK